MTKLVQEDKTSYNDLTKSWGEFSGKIDRSITSLIKGYEADTKKLNRTWKRHTNKIGKHLTETLKELGTDYEDLFETYFKRTQELTNNYWLNSLTRTRNLTEEVDRLQKRVNELEKKHKT